MSGYLGSKVICRQYLAAQVSYAQTWFPHKFICVEEKWLLAGSRPRASTIRGGCLPFYRGDRSTGSGPSLTCNNQGMDLDPVSVASARRHTAAEWRWACLGSRLWLQGKETRTTLPGVSGACAIPLSRFGGMSTVYSVTGWLSLIRGYCRGAGWRKGTTVLTILVPTWGITALKKHDSEMLTIEVTERVLIVSDILNDSCTKHLMFCCNHICSPMLLSSACTKKRKNTDFSNYTWLLTVSLQVARSLAMGLISISL